MGTFLSTSDVLLYKEIILFNNIAEIENKNFKVENHCVASAKSEGNSK